MHLSDVQGALSVCQGALQNYYDVVASAESVNPDVLKTVKNYFEWVNLHTKMVKDEPGFVLPCSALPGKVSGYVYNYLRQEKQTVVAKYYKKDSKTGEYLLCVNKAGVPQKDTDMLIQNLVLRRGHVVWVHFGFNVGHEFGGKHPALILKNAKKVLTVLPLSSQTPNHPELNVQIDRVFGLPLMTRWGNVTRIVPISTQRIDFNSTVGSVKNEVLRSVSSKIQEHGIK